MSIEKHQCSQRIERLDNQCIELAHQNEVLQHSISTPRSPYIYQHILYSLILQNIPIILILPLIFIPLLTPVLLSLNPPLFILPPLYLPLLPLLHHLRSLRPLSLILLFLHVALLFFNFFFFDLSLSIALYYYYLYFYLSLPYALGSYPGCKSLSRSRGYTAIGASRLATCT